jgi:heat shock protein HslJ
MGGVAPGLLKHQGSREDGLHGPDFVPGKGQPGPRPETIPLRKEVDLKLAHPAAGLALAALASAACTGVPNVATSTASPSASSAAVALEGRTWRLVSIDGRPALATVRVTAIFESEANRVAGSAGCNQYFGSATAKGETLAVGGLGSTKMFCPADGVMPQESAYLDALGKATTYRVTGTQLQLGPAPGAVSLVYQAE